MTSQKNSRQTPTGQSSCMSSVTKLSEKPTGHQRDLSILSKNSTNTETVRRVRVARLDTSARRLPSRKVYLMSLIISGILGSASATVTTWEQELIAYDADTNQGFYRFKCLSSHSTGGHETGFADIRTFIPTNFEQPLLLSADYDKVRKQWVIRERDTSKLKTQNLVFYVSSQHEEMPPSHTANVHLPPRGGWKPVLPKEVLSFIGLPANVILQYAKDDHSDQEQKSNASGEIKPLAGLAARLLSAIQRDGAPVPEVQAPSRALKPDDVKEICEHAANKIKGEIQNNFEAICKGDAGMVRKMKREMTRMLDSMKDIICEQVAEFAPSFDAGQTHIALQEELKGTLERCSLPEIAQKVLESILCINKKALCLKLSKGIPMFVLVGTRLQAIDEMKINSGNRIYLDSALQDGFDAITALQKGDQRPVTNFFVKKRHDRAYIVFNVYGTSIKIYVKVDEISGGDKKKEASQGLTEKTEEAVEEFKLACIEHTWVEGSMS